MGPIQQKEIVCRRYFYIGFAFLPLLWLINGVWFGLYLVSKESRAELINNNNSVFTTFQTEKQSIFVTLHHGGGAVEKRHKENKESLNNIFWYSIGSMIGFTIWIILIFVWLIIYKHNRHYWPMSTDWINFNVRRGN